MKPNGFTKSPTIEILPVGAVRVLIENACEEQSNFLLIAACFNAATELDGLGLDAQKCVEALPELVREIEHCRTVMRLAHYRTTRPEQAQSHANVNGSLESSGKLLFSLRLKLDQKGGGR